MSSKYPDRKVKIKLNNGNEIIIYPMQISEKKRNEILQLFKVNSDCIKPIKHKGRKEYEDAHNIEYNTINLSLYSWLINDTIIVNISGYSLLKFIKFEFIYNCNLATAVNMIEIQMEQSIGFVSLSNLMNIIRLSYDAASAWTSGTDKNNDLYICRHYSIYDGALLVDFEEINHTNNLKVEL